MAKYLQDIGSGTPGELTKWLTENSITDAIAGTDYVVPSDLNDYVPYTGATGDVTLGVHGLTLNDITISALTQGSVGFIGSGSVLSEDNLGLHYNDTENRLSVFTTLGNEVLTNPNFTGNATGWTVPSGMAYSSNAVSKTSNGTGALTQNITAYIQREYLLTYILSNVTAGTVTPSVAGVTLTARSANGTYTERFVAISSAQLAFTPSNTARFTIDTISLKPLTGSNTKSNINTGGLSVEGSWSNGSPGTTRHTTINNDGSYSWTDYRFAGVLRGALGVNSSGGFDLHASGGNYFGFYGGNSGLTSTSLFAYLYPTAFVHSSGYGAFGGGINAGSSAANTSTLQSQGGTALKVKKITTSQTLDNTATIWLANAASAVCTGTPSASCASWLNEADCIKWDAHGGCSWNAGSSCSVYNGDQSGCQGQSGCTYDTADCSGVGAYDESSCISYSGCSWSGTDCSGLDEGTCNSTSGCSPNTSDCSSFNDDYNSCTSTSGCSSSSMTDCSAYDGTDQMTCEGNSGCYWDGMSNCYMTCSGMYYTGCSGTYYNCTGSYYTGNCSGTYGSGCFGSPSCSGIDDSTNCGNETGCSWTTAINVNLPNITTCQDRIYGIINTNSSNNDVNINPYAGQTIDFTSSYVLSNYKDGILITNFYDTESCSGFNEGACTPTGCTINYSYCTYDTMDNSCNGDAVCSSHNGDQSGCEAQQYFGSCSGTYVISTNWYIIAKR